jgi:hypothetical protein
MNVHKNGGVTESVSSNTTVNITSRLLYRA